MPLAVFGLSVFFFFFLVLFSFFFVFFFPRRASVYLRPVSFLNKLIWRRQTRGVGIYILSHLSSEIKEPHFQTEMNEVFQSLSVCRGSQIENEVFISLADSMPNWFPIFHKPVGSGK